MVCDVWYGGGGGGHGLHGRDSRGRALHVEPPTDFEFHHDRQPTLGKHDGAGAIVNGMP